MTSFSSLPNDVSDEEISSLQVVRKAQRVGLATFGTPDLAATEKSLLKDLTGHFSEERTWHREVAFTGTTAEQLQELLDTNPDTLITIQTSDLTLDTTVFLRNDTYINGNGVRITTSFNGPALRIEGVSHAGVSHVTISGQASVGVLVHDSHHVVLANNSFKDMAGKGIYIDGDTTYFRVAQSTFTRCETGGITVAGDASYGLIEANSITNNYGESNWMAGIVLTNLVNDDPANIWQHFDTDPPHFATRETLADVPVSAHSIVVRGNQVQGNQSSGIYCDGVYGCSVFDNHVERNDKEGLCLDYGTLSTYVHDNEFIDNGRRMRQSDEALALDGMLDYGRLADGSAVAKLPGISLDNAAYNIVANNTVRNNWGGGVKAVRCAVRNAIHNNTIDNNNRGETETFYFVGIELGNAEGAGETDMDYAACFENTVTGNRITGNHYAGVHISHGGSGNLVTGNTIQDQTHFALTSGSKYTNDISGNTYTGYVLDRSIVPL